MGAKLRGRRGGRKSKKRGEVVSSGGSAYGQDAARGGGPERLARGETLVPSHAGGPGAEGREDQARRGLDEGGKLQPCAGSIAVNERGVVMADDLDGVRGEREVGGQIAVAVVEHKSTAQNRAGLGASPMGVVIAGYHVDGAG
jgi:hypothetical protein